MNTPIIAGFFPDPSVCRVGGEFFLASSSFEYIPGIPIHRSSDLQEWELIGHAVTGAGVVNAAPGSEGASQGLFAPTLRHHDGRFYLATTSIRDVHRGQVIVWADDPSGPWSEPVYVADTIGIDPDLVWVDGQCLLTWRGFAPAGIRQVPIDPDTGAKMGEEVLLWGGSGLADTEGPHLFARDGWWYLVVAEGGTHLGHGISVARSRSPRGPFEAHPANPVFSHRSTDSSVQAIGHADVVDLVDGTWAAVCLGIRQAGAFPRFHVLGRETFLLGVDWQDGWPVFVSDRFAPSGVDHSFEDDFTDAVLHARWVAPSIAPEHVLTADGRFVSGEARERLVCTRVRDHAWQADALVDGDVRLSVRIDARHWYAVESSRGEVRARASIGPLSKESDTVPLQDGDRLAVRVEPREVRFGNDVGPDEVVLGVRRARGFIELARYDGRYLSTEVAGGFTGRMLGVESLAPGAALRSVRYTSGGSGTR